MNHCSKFFQVFLNATAVQPCKTLTKQSSAFSNSDSRETSEISVMKGLCMVFTYLFCLLRCSTIDRMAPARSVAIDKICLGSPARRAHSIPNDSFAIPGVSRYRKVMSRVPSIRSSSVYPICKFSKSAGKVFSKSIATSG